MSYIKGNVLVDLGYSEIFFEVDKFNKAVYKFNLRDRDTEPLEKIALPDERKRILFKKIIKGRFYKFNLSLANSQNLIKATANVILLSQI